MTLVLMFLVLPGQVWLTAQTPQSTVAPGSKRFEVLYEWGLQGRKGGEIDAVHRDSFDSEKKIRLVDARGGPVQYRIDLSDEERKNMLNAILQNDLLSIKDSLFVMGNGQPILGGRLLLDIDGKIKEIRFDGIPTSNQQGQQSTDPEWLRLRKALTVIEGILKARDQQQGVPPHNSYQ